MSTVPPRRAGNGVSRRHRSPFFKDWGNFNRDPVDHPGDCGHVPGDAIRACDAEEDGWGVTVCPDVNRNGTWDRTSTTSGHPAEDDTVA
jgi:hypothetical protein